jgi:small subunit ribosomal protein S20
MPGAPGALAQGRVSGGRRAVVRAATWKVTGRAGLRHGRSACPNRENGVLLRVFFPARQKFKGIRIMANSAQARKRARQSEATRARNASLKSALRTAVKKVRKSIASGDKAAAAKQLALSQSVIDSITDKKIAHKNTTSRTKSRLAHAIKVMT